MAINDSVQLVWAMANREACLAGSGRIEPVHFLLASLTIIDGLYEDAAYALELSRESVAAIFKIAAECRARMKMTDDEVTTARRGIRKTIRLDDLDRDLTFLHRSPESRFMFQRASRRAHEDNADELTLFHLFTELLDDLPEQARTFFPADAKQAKSSSDEWPDYVGGVS